MKTYTTTTGSASPVEREEMRLARIALDHEELAEWLALISTAEQAGQEAAA